MYLVFWNCLASLMAKSQVALVQLLLDTLPHKRTRLMSSCMILPSQARTYTLSVTLEGVCS